MIRPETMPPSRIAWRAILTASVILVHLAMEEGASPVIPENPETLFQYILDSFDVNDPVAIFRHQAMLDNLLNRSDAIELIARCVIFVEEMLLEHGVYVKEKNDDGSPPQGGMYISKIDGHLWHEGAVIFPNMLEARTLCLTLLDKSVGRFGLGPDVVVVVERAMALVATGCGGAPMGLYSLMSYAWISRVVNSIKGLDAPVDLISYATRVYSDITLPRLGELLKEALGRENMSLLRHTPQARRVFYDSLYMSSVAWFRLAKGMDRDQLIKALPQFDEVVAVMIGSDQPASDTTITDAERVQCILEVAQTVMPSLLDISVCVF